MSRKSGPGGRMMGSVKTACCRGQACGMVEVSDGTLTVTMGDCVAVYSETYAWTIRTLTWGGVDVLTATGAHQTVVKDDEWSGSAHGGETDVALTLVVDGKEHSAEDGLAVAGDVVVVRHTSTMGPYIHTHSTTLSVEGGLLFELELEIAGDASAMTKLYPNLLCCSIDTREWLAGLAAGGEDGGSFVDDEGLVLSAASDWVALFAPAPGLALVYAQSPGVYTRIADRAIDNKLYPESDPFTGAVGETYEYAARLRCCAADAGTWQEQARALAAAAW